MTLGAAVHRQPLESSMVGVPDFNEYLNSNRSRLPVAGAGVAVALPLSFCWPG